MRTFAQKQNQPQKPLFFNPAVQRVLQSRAEACQPEPLAVALPRLGYDFSQIPIHSLSEGRIQAKLAINQPEDEFEQEADRVSEQVMRMSGPQLQRACSCGGMCPKCQTKQPDQDHERLQTKQIESSVLVQTSVPPIVHEVLRSHGQPLDPATRAFMEPRFGHDFSNVRLHADNQAAEAANAMGARAFTVGQAIVFAAGEYASGAVEGKRLLAHEMTHVVQQSQFISRGHGLTSVGNVRSHNATAPPVATAADLFATASLSSSADTPYPSGSIFNTRSAIARSLGCNPCRT
jgi:hypothetical protein